MSKRATYVEIQNGLVIGVEVLTIEEVQTKVEQNELDSVIRLGEGDPEPEIGTPAEEVVSSGLGIYALIKDSIVLNVIRADSEFLELLVTSEQIDEAVFLGSDDQRPNSGDSYSDGVFTPFVPNIMAAKLQRIAELRADFDQYLEGLYSISTRLMMKTLYDLALEDGLTNRAAYLRQGITWARDIVTYIGGITNQIMAAPSAAAALAVTWDIVGNIPPDPKIKLSTAVTINN